MCEVLDRIENRGWQKGHQDGLIEGRQSGLIEGRRNGLVERERQIILSLHQNNVSWDVIAASVGKTVDEVKDIAAKQAALLS